MANFEYDEEKNEAIFNGRWRMSNIHQRTACEGETCIVHAPSDTPANRGDWRYTFRDGHAGGRIERECPHGFGHPDVDQVTYLKRTTGETHWGVHACDGCCFEGESGVKEYMWFGEGINCESCGWEPDSVWLGVNPDGSFEYESRYGCYGGLITEDFDSAMGDLRHVISFSDEGPAPELLEMKHVLEALKEKND